jgi:hypothetical protein
MLPSAPVMPPPLTSVEGVVGRQHHAKSRDIPFAALQGQEVMPLRPQVVYVTGAYALLLPFSPVGEGLGMKLLWLGGVNHGLIIWTELLTTAGTGGHAGRPPVGIAA